MTADLTAAREAAIEAGAKRLCEIDDRSDFWSCIAHGTQVYAAGVHSCSAGIAEAEITYDAMQPVIEATLRERIAEEIDREWDRVKTLHTAGGTSQRDLDAMDAGYYRSAEIARGDAS